MTKEWEIQTNPFSGFWMFRAVKERFEIHFFAKDERNKSGDGKWHRHCVRKCLAPLQYVFCSQGFMLGFYFSAFRIMGIECNLFCTVKIEQSNPCDFLLEALRVFCKLTSQLSLQRKYGSREMGFPLVKTQSKNNMEQSLVAKLWQTRGCQKIISPFMLLSHLNSKSIYFIVYWFLIEIQVHSSLDWLIYSSKWNSRGRIQTLSCSLVLSQQYKHVNMLISTCVPLHMVKEIWQ